MKVAIVADHPPFTGIGHYSFELFRNLRKLTDGNADLYYLRWSKNDWMPPAEAGTKVISLAARSPVKSPSLFFSQISSPLPGGYDIYHATHPMLAGVLPDPDRGVVTVEDLLPLRMRGNLSFFFELQFRVLARKIRRMRRIIAISESTRSDLQLLLGIPKKEVASIPFGVNPGFCPGASARERLGMPADRPVLLHVGSEEDRKNIPFLFQVLARARRHLGGLMLVRLGSPTERSMTLLKEMGLQDFVVYTGRKSEDEIISYYRSADLFLFPSKCEGFGLPPLEAMACGCPVIASDASSLTEVVGDGGVLLPLDLDAWVAETVSMLTSREKRSEAVRAGLAHAANFTWRRTAERTLSVYQGILGERA